MNRLNRVLVATDFSDTCENAVSFATMVAARNDAELHLLHVRQIEVDEWGAEEFPEYQAYQQFLYKSAFKKLEDVKPELGVTVVRHVARNPSILEGTLEYAKENEIDLLVVGTHARRGPARWLLGSAAERIIAHSPVPVLVVGGKKRHMVPEKGFTKVVVGLDLNDASGTRLHQGLAIAKQHAAEVVALHVIPNPIYPELAPGGFVRDMLPTLQEYADKKLGELKAKFEGEQVRYETVVGTPSAETTAFAEREGCDLIVVGTTERKGIDRVMLGSTASRIVRSAHCPVLVLPTDEDVNV